MYTEDLSDAWAVIRELVRRIETLERANPLENSSITQGPGMRIAVPEGVHVDPTGSITAGAAALSGAHGGHVRGGKTSLGADGVIRNDDGKVVIANETEIRGKTRVAGQLDADSVLMTYKGVRHTVDQVVGWVDAALGTTDGIAKAAQSTANGAASTANAAQSTANGARSRADAAYSLAEGKVSADSPSIQSPNLVGPKVTGITSGSTGGGWAVLLVNTSTGTLRFLPQG